MSTITKNDKLISLRMPTGVIEFAKRNAKQQGRTMSNYLRWLVIEQMEVDQKQVHRMISGHSNISFSTLQKFCSVSGAKIALKW
jgi:hypothetical protein